MAGWEEVLLPTVVEPKEEKCCRLGVHKSSLHLSDITSGIFNGAPSVRCINNKFRTTRPAGQYCPADVIEVFVCQGGWAQIEMHSRERCGLVVLKAEENKALIVNRETHRSLTLSDSGILMILSSGKFDHNMRKAVEMPFKCRCSVAGPDGLMDPEKFAILFGPLRQSIMECRNAQDLSQWIYQLEILGVTIPQTWRERWGSYLNGVGMTVANFSEMKSYHPKGDCQEVLHEIRQFLLEGKLPKDILQIDTSWYVVGDQNTGRAI